VRVGVSLGPEGVNTGDIEGARVVGAVAEANVEACVSGVEVPMAACGDVTGVSSTGVSGEPSSARAVRAMAVGR
jgi:hypothetical protein